ncbi:HEAT repeat domain-containing protein [Actinomadura macrotermitis]|uniref:HEAT repeat domain-containing protein n=1 Tax=Actinomadura macrotermitis TaxID=2585200 RepID=A0A7K0BZH4_9ACTN|nr:HEAT repeat domain-containing protein [Actinomadura macrotermitis]MQY06581.1 hypothetical protein [Actinomadura macrotermitis]
MPQDLTPAVAWVRLHHHYGTAEDIPGLLLACTDPERAGEAFGELFNKIHHQGGAVTSAAPAVLPALVAWAVDPAFGPRQAALDLIGNLARTGRRARPQFVTAAWPAAWAAAIPPLLALLVDADLAVRRCVAFPLAQAAAHADQVLPALLARWREEDDEPSRLGLVFAAGQLLRHTETPWPPEVIDWLAALPRHDDEAQRFAGVLALRRCGLGGRDPRHIDVAGAYLGTAKRDAWRSAWCGPATPAWTDGLLGEDRDGRTRLAAKLLRSPDPRALRPAAEVMSRWRSPVAELLPLVAAHLSGGDPEDRRFAASVLASAGREAGPWADELAAVCRDADSKAAVAALHALVRIGEPRAVALLAERLGTPAHGAAYATGHGGWWHRPSLHELLVPLRAHSAELLPVVRDRLRSATTMQERRAYARVLAEWGPDARPAIGELEPLLATDAEPWALDALVALDNPEAAAVALPRVLASLAKDDAPAGERLRNATRHWRLTRDPAALLELVRDDTNRPDLLVLAELGPAAAPVEGRLRGWQGQGWERLQIAHVLWRITGDPADARAAALAARLALAQDHALGGYAIRMLGLLADLGPPAGPVAPALRPLLTSDRRPVVPGGWHSMPDDEQLCATVRTVLTAAETG